MNERPISVGDLVMVMKWPCCGRWVGFPMRVKQIIFAPPGAIPRCRECGKVHFLFVAATDDTYAFPLAWLKKINPPSVGDTVHFHEKLTA